MTKKPGLVPYSHLLTALGLSLASAAPAFAESASQSLSGPGATQSVLASDSEDKNDLLGVNGQETWQDRKTRIKDTYGLDFGLDYNALGYKASNSLTGQDNAASGAFRLFGTWSLVDPDGPNTGSLVFKFENRHAYGAIPPTDLGGELGYAGLISSVFSDQGWRATHLYWQQDFADGNATVYAGWLDVTDYLDVYALASPWSGFSNLAFQTGSGTIGGLPDGALGVMVGGFLSDNFYAAASVVDANGDATDPLGGFDTLFGEGETFKTVEFGWTSGADALFLNNAHISLWQIDARSQAGSSEGHGIAFSYTQAVNNRWLPFVRGGWSEGGGSLYEAALSAGFGYSEDPSRSMLGVGVNWSRPNRDTFGTALGDQTTIEIFKQVQLTEGVEITPSIQIIKNPALFPAEDVITLLGLRFRAAF
ncbi:carbohydrate porin [Shimia biformata]|uniref:carbohydrate porin n=1 Tax=Shimia biformata TaxID=1294299 RepID=UPI00194F65EB|nr:carbohydrate porin [Shimia biformata]